MAYPCSEGLMALQEKQRHVRLVVRHTRRKAIAVLLSTLTAWHALTELRRRRRMALLRLLTKNVLKRKREAFSRYAS